MMLSELEFNDLYPEVISMLRDNCAICAKHEPEESVREAWDSLGLMLWSSVALGHKVSYDVYKSICLIGLRPNAEDIERVTLSI